MLDKRYRPAAVEARQYARWQEAGAFRCGRLAQARPYTIVIPPPNVTGSLHMGHALNNTLQDILIRLERMRGRDVLWQPGTDHAGIATQMVVERQLVEEGLSRHDLGRAAFIERVWRWKEESGGAISEQLRRLGASCDWSRERFTMDEGLSRAVCKVFVDLYKQGLIYRDKRLVNWDCKLKTAISDLEVEQRQVDGFLWHFKYPIEDTENAYITVATTRPETMLGDTAVAVHPADDRYRGLVGKYAVLPIVGRRLAIVADEIADPDQGSGAVKITPAHDVNDFEVGRRHDLELINVLDSEGRLNDNAPPAYRGLDRFEARERIVAEMDSLGLLEKVEEHVHVLPYGDRSGVVIEPWLTDQWYVDAAALAKPAIEAVEQGETVFVPRPWEKTFFEWMRNIQPWCISRQIWWGHQIPAWYGPDGEIFVELTEQAAREAAKAHYGEAHFGEDVALRRDDDVLDTWFSSALWPFSTLGWPEDTPEVERYYPTDVLVTGFDIIFFWVARMMMMGLRFLDRVPFHTVYIHALVRDEKGHKMSKSKGNIIDPLELIDSYGADALRFTLAAMAAQGRDIKLSGSRVAGDRNFATKLWNAARFCEMNECKSRPGFAPEECRQTVNRWIVGETAKAAGQVTLALDSYKFNEAASAIYHFVWGTFCDWYLEFIKRALLDGDGQAGEEIRATAGWVLDHILLLLHPFMPFVTEELWQRLGGERESLLALSPWPDHSAIPIDGAATAEMEWVVRLISQLRSIRAQYNVAPAKQVAIALSDANQTTDKRLEGHGDLIQRLAHVHLIDREVSAASSAGTIQIFMDEATVDVYLAEVIDIVEERSRLAREREEKRAEIEKIDKKLANQGFIAKAPAQVIETQRQRRAEAELAEAKLAEALERLGA